MAEHPNIELARGLVDALNRGETEALAASLADDVVWHYIGGTEPIRGKAAILESMAPSAGDYKITGTVHDVIANDEHTVALIEATATRDGKTFTYRTAEVMHVKDGKITERWAFSDDTAAIAAFFA